MKKILLVVLVLLLVFGGGIGLGYYIRSQTLNPRAIPPSIFVRILTFFIQRGERVENDLLYHNTGLIDFIANGSSETKVAVEGVVENIIKEPDGDYHVIIRPQYVAVGVSLVTEFIPEITLPLPKVGDHIKIWGLVRFDELHNWWELHPVIGWQQL